MNSNKLRPFHSPLAFGYGVISAVGSHIMPEVIAERFSTRDGVIFGYLVAGLRAYLNDSVTRYEAAGHLLGTAVAGLVALDSRTRLSKWHHAAWFALECANDVANLKGLREGTQ